VTESCPYSQKEEGGRATGIIEEPDSSIGYLDSVLSNILYPLSAYSVRVVRARMWISEVETRK
jgi:hypothetical protein